MSDDLTSVQSAASGGLFARLRAMPNETPQKMLIFTVALCFVCAVFVSSSRVLLRPFQEHNKEVERSRNILKAAGLLEAETDVLDVFKKRVEPKVVDLATGQYVGGIDAATFDPRKAAKDPARSKALAAGEDIAGIKRRANFAPVYLIQEAGQLKTIVLPVHGYGLWSTMYGFLALKGDALTVSGLTFYEHGETPGLGAEVANPAWQAKWKDKLVYKEDGKVGLDVIKGRVDPSQPDARYQVDGISGSTLTSRGVNNLMHYWLGGNGFGPFLARLRTHKG